MSYVSNRCETPKIVLVTGSLEGGGAERVMADMATYWAAKGWQVTLATWTGPEVEDFYLLPSSITRVWLDVYSPNNSMFAKLRSNIRRNFKLRRLLSTSRPDVVLSFIDVSNIQTVLAALGLKVRVVISERQNPDQTEGTGAYSGIYTLSKPWRMLRALVYRWADLVTALNADAAEWIKQECSVEVEVIPNPLRSLPSVIRERELLILGVGRLVKEKGFDLLLNAFERISVDFPDWRVVIIGQGPDRAELHSLCEKLSLEDRVEILNPERDIETWMARAGLVVLPSRFEAYGNAALESLGMGAAVITTRCSGPSSFINDRVNGCLVPVEDIDALARVMAELMAKPDLRVSLGKAALKVKDSHRQDVIMRRWEACLLPDRESKRVSDGAG